MAPSVRYVQVPGVSISFGRPGGQTQDMMVGIRRRERRYFHRREWRLWPFLAFSEG